MNRLSVITAVALAVLTLSACGHRSARNTDSEDSLRAFDQEQLEASIKMEVDSLASEMSRLELLLFLQDDGNGGLKLTEEELKIKPDYLLNPVSADSTTTLAEKYRMLGALDVDRKLASLYEMPTEEYDKAIVRLTAEISDPSLVVIQQGGSIAETSRALYDAMEANGRMNCFWQLAASVIIEQFYITARNSEKLSGSISDEAAASATYRLSLIIDALKRLSAYDRDIKPVVLAMVSLSGINATTAIELKHQVDASRDKIESVRKLLLNP